MLKYKLIHPELLEALGRAGHGDQIILADSNFPVASKPPAHARKIYLNLAPGILPVTEILKVLLEAIPIEEACVMSMANGERPPIEKEFRALLPADVEIKALGRFEFYDAVSRPSTMVAIATGEQRLYANLLLTVGVVKPG